jgi:hypothetical protein
VSSLTNILNINTLTSDLLQGTFTCGNNTIEFISRPTGCTLSVLGINLLSINDFGSFLRIDVGARVFLVGTAVELVNKVIDCTSNILNLPELDPATLLNGGLLGLTDNLPIFNGLLGSIPLARSRTHEKRLTSCLTSLLNNVNINLLPLLSIQLALNGINGFSHPCSQPIHLCALNLIKINADIDIDLDLVNLANLRVDIDADVVIPGVVDIEVNTCGNANFGQCGVDGTCWKWVCGGCGGFEACKQRDCACDCQGEASLACINIAATRCDAVATCSSTSGGLLGGILKKM